MAFFASEIISSTFIAFEQARLMRCAKHGVVKAASNKLFEIVGRRTFVHVARFAPPSLIKHSTLFDSWYSSSFICSSVAKASPDVESTFTNPMQSSITVKSPVTVEYIRPKTSSPLRDIHKSNASVPDSDCSKEGRTYFCIVLLLMSGRILSTSLLLDGTFIFGFAAAISVLNQSESTVLNGI